MNGARDQGRLARPLVAESLVVSSWELTGFYAPALCVAERRGIRHGAFDTHQLVSRFIGTLELLSFQGTQNETVDVHALLVATVPNEGHGQHAWTRHEIDECDRPKGALPKACNQGDETG